MRLAALPLVLAALLPACMPGPPAPAASNPPPAERPAPGTAEVPRGPAVARDVPRLARTMRLTIYDDGLSCPGGCDAHVVMHRTDNGTRNAFHPSGSRDRPTPCRNGEDCRICFAEAEASCMTARYRGGGPPAGTFDFTPAFYDAHCARPDIPAALRAHCGALDGAARRDNYDRRSNCIGGSGDPRCAGLIAAAQAAQDADAPQRRQCLALGEERYNAQQPSDATRRSEGCNYSLLPTGGPNSQGTRWRRLQPGACRPGTFVGADGLDCCNANVRFAASLGPECRGFFPLNN